MDSLWKFTWACPKYGIYHRVKIADILFVGGAHMFDNG